jgi:hypothetical protein
MSQLTVGWTRAESTADLPQDSAVVVPEKALTVGWKPMLGTAVLDWDPADLLVPPGAGPDPDPPTPPKQDPGPVQQDPGPPQSVPPQPSRSAPEPPPLRPDPPGAPAVLVTARRTMSLFRKSGLVVDITAPVDATVTAVLMGSITERRRGKLVGPVRRRLTRTKSADVRARKRTRLVLPISSDGRKAIRDYDALKATLQVASTYRDGRKLTVERSVLLASKPLAAKPKRK